MCLSIRRAADSPVCYRDCSAPVTATLIDLFRPTRRPLRATYSSRTMPTSTTTTTPISRQRSLAGQPAVAVSRGHPPVRRLHCRRYRRNAPPRRRAPRRRITLVATPTRTTAAGWGHLSLMLRVTLTVTVVLVTVCGTPVRRLLYVSRTPFTGPSRRHRHRRRSSVVGTAWRLQLVLVHVGQSTSSTTTVFRQSIYSQFSNSRRRRAATVPGRSSSHAVAIMLCRRLISFSQGV